MWSLNKIKGRISLGDDQLPPHFDLQDHRHYSTTKAAWITACFPRLSALFTMPKPQSKKRNYSFSVLINSGLCGMIILFKNINTVENYYLGIKHVNDTAQQDLVTSQVSKVLSKLFFYALHSLPQQSDLQQSLFLLHILKISSQGSCLNQHVCFLAEQCSWHNELENHLTIKKRN